MRIFMDLSTVKHYVLNIGIGAAGGALFSNVAKNMQIWESPQGGTITCLFANRVAPNSWAINAGRVFAFTADVPTDYTLAGKVVPTLCTFNTLLISCIGLGILIGAAFAAKRQKAPGAAP